MKYKYLTFLLFFAYALFSQSNVSISIDTPNLICTAGSCIDLNATYSQVKETTDYQVSSIPYNPTFAFTGGTMMNTNNDDLWSSAFILPFNFCFYGNTYNQILIGSNGVIHFPDGTQIAGGLCPLNFNTPIPSATFPIKNAIYGVFQDVDIRTPPVTSPAIQNVNYYIAGIAPNRYVVINFNELPQYACNTSVGLQSSQIVLYETSNNIKINIEKRTSCFTWNNGSGLVGLQNQTGTISSVPPGRNTGNWSTTNESWEFTPNGNSITNFEWKKNGNFYSNANPINICPAEGDVFEAVVTYNQCNSSQIIISDSETIHIEPEIIANNPNNISTCVLEGEVNATIDLTSNEATYGIDVNNFSFYYHTSLIDATNRSNTIANPTSFMSSGQTIYVAIENDNTGCYIVKNFNLIINQGPPVPTGSTTQLFTSGQTLANLVVTGDNIIWYDAVSNGNVLSNNTPLVNNATYYAASSTSSGCPSGRMTPGRLGVLALETLSIDGFNMDGFSAYPNPVKEVLNLSYTKEISKVSVHNLLGQEVMTKTINATQSKIDMSNLSNGTYLVKVTVDGLVKTLKVVKQ